MSEIYDDQTFFKAYGKLPRSVDGLKVAGEWPALKRLIPDLKGKKVLDLGCGYGWHCQYFAENGAEVIGLDASEKMIAQDRQKNNHQNITYVVGSMENLDFPAEQFDLVFSSLAIHYLADFPKLVQDVRRILRPSGQFLFSVEHPIYTSRKEQDFIYDANGQALFFPVDNYFKTGARQTHFLGSPVEKFHRTVEDFIEPLLENGFSLRHLVEPVPTSEVIQQFHWENELRRPMMLIISAEKKIMTSKNHDEN